MRLKSLELAAAAALLALVVIYPGMALAADNQAGGISLSPPEEAVAVRQADSADTFNLTLANNTKSLQELDLTTSDFGSLNDTGGVLLEGSNSYTQRYGLVSWLSLGTDTVILNPGEKRSVPVTIYNRSSLQPGGHYGAVVATVNSTLNGQSGNLVAINQRLLSLILVDKVGGEHYNLKLAGIEQNGNWLHLPNDIKLQFQNPGNVHVVPRGLVQLVSPGGTVVAQGVINDESSFILPETFQEMYVPLTKVGSAYPLPGLYHIRVKYRYDGITNYATNTYAVKFIDLGLYLLLSLLIIGAAVFWWWRQP